VFPRLTKQSDVIHDRTGAEVRGGSRKENPIWLRVNFFLCFVFRKSKLGMGFWGNLHWIGWEQPGPSFVSCI